MKTHIQFLSTILFVIFILHIAFNRAVKANTFEELPAIERPADKVAIHRAKYVLQRSTAPGVEFMPSWEGREGTAPKGNLFP